MGQIGLKRRNGSNSIPSFQTQFFKYLQFFAASFFVFQFRQINLGIICIKFKENASSLEDRQ